MANEKDWADKKAQLVFNVLCFEHPSCLVHSVDVLAQHFRDAYFLGHNDALEGLHKG